MDVIAPATLDAGYTFQIEINGRVLTITVPDGGVEEGQVFTVSDPVESQQAVASIVDDIYEPPHGAWKDGLFDCFTLGCCHPSCFIATWFDFIGLAQVMERMNLTWFADPETSQRTPGKTFKTVVAIFSVLLVLSLIFMPSPVDTLQASDSLAKNTQQSPVSFIISIFSIVLVTKTRLFIRKKYNIATTYCADIWEDILCSCCCGCCTIAQMLRHTANYEGQDAKCCSPTGLIHGEQIV